MISLYSVAAMLGIGVYMIFVQSHSLDTVSHLEREAKFTKTIGTIYFILGIIGGIVLIV